MITFAVHYTTHRSNFDILYWFKISGGLVAQSCLTVSCGVPSWLAAQIFSVMHSDEKTSLAHNQCDLETAQQKLLARSKDPFSCFECMSSLNRAAVTMCLGTELSEAELAALCEVLQIQGAVIDAAYAHYLIGNSVVNN